MSNKLTDKYTTKSYIDVIKYRWAFITFSLLLVIPSILVMIYSVITYQNHSPLRLGIDFTGGTMLQYGFKGDLQKSDINKIREQLKSIGIENAIIQVEKSENMHGNSKQESDKNQRITSENQTTNNKTVTKLNKNGAEDEKQINTIVSIRTAFLESESENSDVAKVNASLRQEFGEFTPLQVNAIGPTLGNELFKNALIAILLAFIGITGYLTVRFNMDFALFALVALFHDAIFVCGAFSLFGLLFGTEIDSLFITAILTVIGFSVHDTIVVYDRIRENIKFHAKNKSFNEIVNISVNQTLARSINTSVTTLLTLGALYFFGGVTTKDFVLAMILGIIAGTYSSIFNASVLLAWWREKTGHRVA
ncbi:MAG TPA: protein translocase subunit SecF [Candidatus Gastranaerophilales bacterium]|nr:protein translocase subunit SecF [Candidatus Gastranaerophilales bacterium]